MFLLSVGYAYFRHAKSMASFRRIFPGCHLTRSNGTHRQNDEYCRKTRAVDGSRNANVYSRGELPADPADRGESERLRWETAWANAVSGNIEEIPADIRVRQYGAIKRIEADYMPPMDRLPGPCGIWIKGISGAGKTRAVLDQFPDAFPKPRSVWWDGYQNEPVVLVDDLDKFDVKLGGKLKHWADAYPFIGESKGSSRKIRPSRLFVTSQYSIDEIWTDTETRDALERRFIVIEKFEDEPVYLF